MYAKPLAKSKLFPLESLRFIIGFSYLYEICNPVTVSYDMYRRRLIKVIAKAH